LCFYPFRNIFFAVLLHQVFNETAGDIFLYNFSIWQDPDKKLRQLKSSVNFGADDAAIFAHSGKTLQSLSINVKTFVLELDLPAPTVESFNYLGLTITSTFSLEEEINIKLGKAMAGFQKESGKTQN
jgi:hypothetical protein